MLVEEHTPRVVAGLRKLRPELTPAPHVTPDTAHRISGVLRQYWGAGEEWRWVRAAVRGGCLLAWREGTLPPRPAARLPLRYLHLRAATTLPHAFQLSRLTDDATVATFQACSETEYARWVRALCVEILRQTPLPQVRFLDVLPAADTNPKPTTLTSFKETPVPPKPPPRARRRLLSSGETKTSPREHSPAATDEGIVIVDEEYEDSSSDRSLDLSIELHTRTTDVVDGSNHLAKKSDYKCDNCVKLSIADTNSLPYSLPPQPIQHHTLPRADAAGKHRYLKRWEGAGHYGLGHERGRSAIETARRKSNSLEFRARSCSPHAQEAASYVPVKERRAIFESLSNAPGALARSSEHLTRPITSGTSPRRAASMQNLQVPPMRSVSDLRQFFESVARTSSAPVCGFQRRSAPPIPPHHRPYTSLSCA